MAKHIVLFLLTVISTYLVGAHVIDTYLAGGGLFFPGQALAGVFYSFSIMSILLAHEMGHYSMSRKYGVPVTLPYFIPFPLPPFGTFGAIIKMKGIIINKKALLDIGVAGPLSGFILAVPASYIGIKLSPVIAMGNSGSGVEILGEPLLFKLFKWIIIGQLPPDHDILLHPIGYAGWVGLFVTALNLLPVGQLDGGHIIYSVFGEKSRWAYIASIVALVILALLFNPGWLLLIILLLIFGMRHPRPFDEETPLDRKRKVLAGIMLLVFVLSFTPAPFPGLSLFGNK